MAMKILTSRLLCSTSLPLRVCVTSSASMSSSSSSSTPSSNKSDVPTTIKKKKRESLRSMFATVFGGNVDPADPKYGPLPADKVDFPDLTEAATGEHKLFLLAFENGIIDPYCTLPTERNGAGTKDNPVKIESFINERLVACACEDSMNSVRFTNLYKGEPRRCQCGHWMELVDAPKFWEKIPREDLLEIPYFRELEEEGKLSKLLSGELDKEAEHKHH